MLESSRIDGCLARTRRLASVQSRPGRRPLLSVDRHHAGVDAIVLETPYERVRYDAYLYRLQGERITAVRVHDFLDEARNRLGFLVYAHSRNEEDRAFLAQFHAPSLILPDGAGPMRFDLTDGYGNRYAVRFDPRSFR